tara:strand:+ start:981 stop:1190 length:210 start_codon:yes stop_codon:yes gene_type:complete
VGAVVTIVEYVALGAMVYEYLTEDDEEEVLTIEEQIKKLLEDVIVTNKANLILRNVRQDLYEPLNIDSM